MKVIYTQLRSLRSSLVAIVGTGLAGSGLGFADGLPTINLLENDRISIFAEKPGERKYAEGFAETVYEAAFETTGESAGKGLIIIGNYEDPHPIVLIKRYMDVTEGAEANADGLIFDAIIDRAISKWEEGDESLEEEIGMDIESVAYVIPMPLEPAILNLYLVARQEDFNEDAIENRYRTIKPMELKFGDFESFDWVIYLPPRNAIDRVIKDVLPHVMKKEKLGFFKRTLVKGAVFTFKPVIRDAMEGFRKSLLYEAILKANSDFLEEEIEVLTNAYREALMPKGKIVGGNKSDRSLEAIREQLKENEAYANDPYVPPILTIDEDSEQSALFVGEYKGRHGKTKIFQDDGFLYYQFNDRTAHLISPVSENLFTTEDRGMTIEFLAGENGEIEEAELRKVRFRRTIKKL